ncbi:MAG: ankyrin repeat domain-containing protein, partial [Gaiellaceae bacterium]
MPAAPGLEQLRKQAKELLRAHRAGDPAAAARVAAHHPRPDEPLKLAGAQLVVARELGFPS